MKTLKNWKKFNESQNSDILVEPVNKHELEDYKNRFDLKDQYLNDVKYKISVLNKNYDLMDEILELFKKYWNLLLWKIDKFGINCHVITDDRDKVYASIYREKVIYASEIIKNVVMENI